MYCLLLRRDGVGVVVVKDNNLGGSGIGGDGRGAIDQGDSRGKEEAWKFSDMHVVHVLKSPLPLLLCHQL